MLLIPSFKERSSPLYNQENQSPENAPVKISTNFSLRTASNRELNSKTLRGKFLLIYFGNTHYQNICLPHLTKMQNILQIIRKKQNSIKFLFITTNPEKDTVEYLHNYFMEMDPNIIPLTGTKDQINRVLKKFNIYQTCIDLDKAKQQNCSIPFYLIGKDGDLIKNYDNNIPSKDIAKDIAHYIKVS